MITVGLRHQLVYAVINSRTLLQWANPDDSSSGVEAATVLGRGGKRRGGGRGGRKDVVYDMTTSDPPKD